MATTRKPSKPDPAARKPAKATATPEPRTAPVMIRMEIDLQERLDAWVEQLNAASEGPRWTRTDVIRVTLQRALRERGAKGEAP